MTEFSAIFDRAFSAGPSHRHRPPALTTQACPKPRDGPNWRGVSRIADCWRQRSFATDVIHPNRAKKIMSDSIARQLRIGMRAVVVLALPVAGRPCGRGACRDVGARLAGTDRGDRDIGPFSRP